MVMAPSSTLANGVDRRKWTPEEDALLTRAMARFRHTKEIRWTEIAAEIPDRSAKACRKRWVNGLNERLKKGSWTSEEDERLREGVSLLSSDWARIADHVGQRSGDQCSKRWREVLDPAINKSNWTPEEDKLLIDLFHKHGSAWQVISTHFYNRRALQCRNRCCKLLSLHSHPRAKRATMFSKTDEAKLCSPSEEQVPQHSLPTSPANVDLMTANPEVWSSLNLGSPTTPAGAAPSFVPDAFSLGTMSMQGVENGPMTTSPMSPMFGLQDVQKGPANAQSLPMPSNNGECGSLFLDSWNKVQGFSSLKRKDPPAALNLGGSVNQPVNDQDSFNSPLINISPSLCSSISTSPTTPSVTDTLSLQGMMPSPMLQRMPNQINEGINFCAPMPTMPAEKNMNAMNWNLYCDNQVPMHAAQNTHDQNQFVGDMYSVMMNNGASVNAMNWLPDLAF